MRIAVVGSVNLDLVASVATLPAPGETIKLIVKSEAMHLFDPVTEQRLR